MITPMGGPRSNDGPIEPERGRDREPPEPVSGAGAAHAALEHLAIARTPEVAATDGWADAGGKVLRFHLTRMLARVAGAITGEDPEEVHAMRVAARRVRAAWRVFGNAYERTVVRDQLDRLRILGSELGAVRDLDVQLAILGAARSRGSKRDRAGLAPLVEAWTAERAFNHGKLIDRLASRWFTTFVLDHERLVTMPGDAVKPVAAHSPSTVRTRAPSVIWESYQAVRYFEDVVTDADVSTLHELRIATKWLRYTLEFVREPMEPRATELIRRVVVLQDHLGDIHDLHATAARARGSLERADLPSSERAAIDWLLANADVRVQRLQRRSGPAWRGVADADFRRGMGRALAGL